MPRRRCLNAAAGNLHLVAGATAVIDQVSALQNALQDWDGDARPQGSSTDYGADEYNAIAQLKPNQPPTVTLTAPTNGASFTAPATATVSATAADADGTVASVESLAGTTSLGSATTSPDGLS